MNIMHMISGGDVGGAKTHVLSLLTGLNKTENIHLVCFTEGEFADEARQLGIPTTVIEDKNLLRARKRILAMIRHDGYQVIHCHGARANMMGMLLKRRARLPMVSTIHSDYRLDYLGRPLASLTYGNINKLALPCFDAWIGVSGQMSDMLIERGFDPQRIFTLYNGVDFATERKPLPREEYLKSLGLEVDENTVVFGIAARISPVKDLPTLIRGFAAAQKRCPNIRLVIAGSGDQMPEIRALADSLCPAGTVCFAGWVRDTDSFYNALDVNMLTSLSEGFPYALPEGARMHCATISTEVGGVPYLIIDGVTGLLFRPRDVDALAQHMLTLAEQPELRKKLSDALYEKAKREFSFDVMLEKQKTIYETIIRRSRRPKNERDGVVICGAYGRGNCGDNTILNAIVAQLRSIDPDLPLCALSRNPRETRLCAHISSIHMFNTLKTAHRMRHAKLYISGGGTLMQDATSTRSLLYYLFSIRQAAHCGCRVMLYGCGIGPISRPRNRKRTVKTLNRCADIISVRDHYSLEALRANGVIRPEIRLTADPALLIDAPQDEDQQRYLRRCGIAEDKRYLMVAVRPWQGFEEKIAAFASAAEYAHREYGLIPVLYAMEPNRDEAAVNAVAQKLHCEHLVLSAGSDGSEVIALVRRMSLVLSMRLHALIFASGQGVPMIGVVYDPKVSGFLDDLGQEFYLPLQEVTAAALGDLIDSAMAEQAFEQENIARLRRLAAENETLARRLLSE